MNEIAMLGKLYNTHRNIYLDMCYGESETPLGEWLILSESEEYKQIGRLQRVCRLFDFFHFVHELKSS